MTYLAPRHAAAVWRRTTFSDDAALTRSPFSIRFVARSSARSARPTRTSTIDGETPPPAGPPAAGACAAGLASAAAGAAATSPAAKARGTTRGMERIQRSPFGAGSDRSSTLRAPTRTPGSLEPPQGTSRNPLTAGGVDHGVVEVVAAGAVERARARDEAQRRPAGRAVDACGREGRLAVVRDALDAEPDAAPVAPHDHDQVAGPQRAQMEEDGGAGIAVDVARDDRGAALARPRAARPPARVAEVLRDLEAAVALEA